MSVNSGLYLGQPMFKIIDTARGLEQQGIDIVHLEIGDPDFNTPDFIKKAGMSAIDHNETHYVSSWGIPELRLAIAEATRLSRGFAPDLSQVLVTPGANVAIFYAVATTADPGDEVLYPDPGFPTYLSTFRAVGVNGVPYQLKSENEFTIRAADIEPLITPKTKTLIINSPQNPTGAVTPEKQLREVYELARSYDLWIYSDEIYARMNYGDIPHFSVASLDKCRERVILSNGFSKAFSMTGWRLGTLVAPAELTEKIMLLLQTTASCVQPFVQKAGLAALQGDQSQVNKMMTTYKERRDFVVQRLSSIEGIRCHNPGGAFYAFPNVSSFGLSSEQFCELLLTEGHVATVPGSHFGDAGEGHIRIAYATSLDRLELGLNRLEEFCKRIR